ncbi:MAG: PEP-CTERM sorting domain-containing protein, partial [Planctomycetota bacterium]|nr:PEP-CTERM sorting domain-containing protein [Planctomycetota bacterium]
FGTTSGTLSGSASGSMLVNLTGTATWEAVGTTGKVFWGRQPGNVHVGTWTIVAPIPEPGTLALLGLALAGLALGMSRCRKRSA